MKRRALLKRIGLLLLVGALTALAVAYLRTTDWFRVALDHRPLVFAHRGGSGQWPQNSRTALHNTIAAGYAGVEVDIVLTADGVPVLSHDPWVHDRLCRHASGRPLGEQVLIKDVPLATLLSDYRCGGVRDEDFPDATPVEETIATLDEVLALLAGAPVVALYLDVKIDGDLTAPPAAYADAIFRRWRAAALPNPLYVEGPDPESLAAFRAAAGDGADPASPFTAVLSYPAFSAEQSPTLTGLLARWRNKLDQTDPLARARAAHADAIAAPTAVLTWHSARQLLDAGVGVILFTPNTRQALDHYCGWPATGLITDYPQLGGCE